MNIAEKLTSLGYTLPQAAKPVASYVPFVISDSHIFISGQIPFLNGQAMHQGTLGQTMTIEQGQEAARACALNILSQVNEAVEGDWSRVKRCVKLGAFVACTSEFTQHPQIVNGASDLIVAVMGDAGLHARSAVGVPSLPLNCGVEIDAVFEMN